MAQWAGQYTGRTHESKIKDIEDTLLIAINSLKNADETTIGEKRKSVVKLCERLLSARHKAIKARISKITETRSFETDDKKTTSLRKKEKQLKEKGIDGIIQEFEITELVKYGTKNVV